MSNRNENILRTMMKNFTFYSWMSLSTNLKPKDPASRMTWTEDRSKWKRTLWNSRSWKRIAWKWVNELKNASVSLTVNVQIFSLSRHLITRASFFHQIAAASDFHFTLLLSLVYP
jgi:hypothetical protein